MKILLFGAEGQLGQELSALEDPTLKIDSFNKNQLDFFDFDKIRKTINFFKPDVIINAAAFTSVDKAEFEKNNAYIINSEAVNIISQESKKINCLLVHYSTDYIFDGNSTRPYKETDMPSPLSVYGMSKLEGENKIIESGCEFLIFRTSWVYSLKGNNFANKIIHLALTGKDLRVVDDQIGVPTSAALLASASIKCIKLYMEKKKLLVNLSGIYNMTPKGQTTWYNYADYLLSTIKENNDVYRKKFNKVYPVKTKYEGNTAKRPHYSVLNNEKLFSTFNIEFEDWTFYLNQFIEKYIQSQKQ